MNRRRTFWLRITAPFRKHAGIDGEMRLHISFRTRENIQSGMDLQPAMRGAPRDFGWAGSTKESCRGQCASLWLA